ncbi:DUF6778 family protein [Amylibacter sp. IMCC11727]|uniref:DUF6778 family protein n=1 Tax=Amylibacter sp. IMCC11727 TaxID=3039851 RepID=UPI00244E5BAD|nr:DUF6778 family protein [Amylibacter sp. IMCC11727]WGI21033.1 hypothetical protein QBD29_13075 [Amylibacter sp. IMCC11727]
MFSMGKIAGLFAIALTTTACVSSNNASQNLVTEAPSAVFTSVPTTQQTDQTLSFFPQENQVASLNTTAIGVASQYEVVDVQVAVPEYLVVSEADVYVPKADIVWREDPLGDRRAQVKAIMTDALSKGTNALVGPRKVVMAARVNMFHAITEKARNTVGGKHNVQFDYVLLDAETRQPVTTVQSIDASLKAFGGSKAYRAMREGKTQKVRITNHVAAQIQQALRAPVKG